MRTNYMMTVEDVMNELGVKRSKAYSILKQLNNELDKLNATQEEWKLRAMGTTIGCHTVIKKGTEDNVIKTYDLT